MGVLGGLILKPTAEPIMSFQTDLNGTFDPSMTIASGTLKWIIDGEEQITNTPSKVLTGSTVDVEVFANGITDGASVTNTQFQSQNIIGDLDFSYFTLSGSVWFYSNTGVNNVAFSTNANTSNSFQCFTTNLSSLDVSNFTLSGVFFPHANSNLTSVTFSTNANTTTDIRFNGNNITGHLDLSNVTINGTFRADINSNLTSVTFSNGTNVINNLRLNNCNLSSIDLSNVTFSGLFHTFVNPNLTSIIFSTGANTSSDFRIYSCDLSTVDLSNITMSGDWLFFSMSNLVSITMPSYTSSLSNVNGSSCALNLTTVDNIFSSINTFMSANAPTSDLVVTTIAGTSASPTDGAANTDIVNLDSVVYPATAFDFTFSIN